MATQKNITRLNPTESQKAFRDCFEKLAYSVDYASVFRDFVDFSLLMLNMNKRHEDFKELEDRWPKPEHAHLFSEMLMLLGNLSDDFTDAMGDLFMECVSFGRNGQFFTPQPICDMMAIMNLGEHPEDGETVNDCSCGSGRMLLGAAKINRNLKFYGADNDLLCVKMTVINFILNSMTGEVAHMNSLSMEHYKSWHVKKILNGTHYLPYYYVTGPGQTNFIQRLREEVKKELVVNPKPIEVITTKMAKHGQLILF